MWYENESSRNMTTVQNQSQRDERNSGGGDATMVDEPRNGVNSKVDLERVNASERKVPVKRYKTRTNSEWQKAFGSRLPCETIQRMDYILVFKKPSDSKEDNNRRRDDHLAADARRSFMDAMEGEGIDVLKEEIGENVYLKLHTPLWRLCKEAEREGLKMPVKDMRTDSDDEEISCKCWSSFESKYLETDSQDDFIAGPFKTDRIEIFKDSDNADIIFRPALRSLMTYWILVNIDIRKTEEKQKSFLYRKNRGKDALVKQGLLYMLHKNYYTDAFPVHDEARNDPTIDSEKVKLVAMYGSQICIKNPVELESSFPDTRQKMNDAWVKFHKYQPLWMIRDYFGEKIGLYFAWCGTLITTLWLPMIFGLGVFVFGLCLSVSRRLQIKDEWENVTSDKATNLVDQSITIVKESFDNDVTPYFALAVAVWGTVFLEFWKRTNSTLAYEWDVNSFEKTEPDRPGYEASSLIQDPITGELVKHSSVIKKIFKYGVSFVTLIFMVCLVFIASAAIIVYRIVLTVDYCINMTPTTCLMATAVGSSLLNALAILILGKIYEVLAVKLTDWENHRTQTQYDDSLIVKLFAFQFANSYTSLYYIAFVRGRAFQSGVFGLGPQYKDTCGETTNLPESLHKDISTCMPMLSFQVLVLMLTKPLPKLVKDVFLPILKWLWRSKIKRLFQHCCCCCGLNQISSSDQMSYSIPTFLEREFSKADVGDFTLTEYTEKVIIYGFLMLFAASLPIAPLIALLTILIDIRIDAKRLLWLNRRPVALIAQDVGTWYSILNFLNVLGIVSNACLIAFTSRWGSQFDITGKLIIVIGFEHIVVAIKILIAALIPDIPSSVELAARKETYIIQKIMDTLSDETKESSIKGSAKQRRKFTKSPDMDDEIRSILRSPEAPKNKRYTKHSSNDSWESPPELNSPGQVNFAYSNDPGGNSVKT